ncbi:flippase [Pseudomonas fluorescens]|uniref:flippase n=1 Tax=Pseudomonas fluorescens TaxID=294 RepID=UPI000A7D17A0|nr:flippase [Pseudomonas fluorescens]
MNKLTALLYKITPKSVFKKLQLRAELQVIAYNSGWLLLDKGTRLLIGLFVSAWVARYLGPTELGELSYTITLIAFFQAIATLGAESIVVRDISHQDSDAGEILGTIFFLRLVVGFLCWLIAIAFLIATYGLHERIVLLATLVGSALVFQAADTIDLWFQSQNQNRKTVAAKIIAYLLSSSTKIALILCKAPLEAFAAAIALEMALTAFGLYITYKKSTKKNRWLATKKCAHRILHESWPFIISGLSIMTYMRIDQLMIKNSLGAEALGLYSVMLPLSTLWHVIPTTLSIVLLPFISKKKTESAEAYNNALLIIFRYFLACSVIISIVVSALSPLIITTLYGPRYKDAAPILSIHIFTIIPVFLGVARSLWIINEKRSMLSLYATFIGGAISVASNWILIPLLGMTGAAMAAVASYFISAVLLTAIFDLKIFLMQLGIRRSEKP